MNKKVKIGIIGVGKISEFHINAYLKNPLVEIYAMCDINPDRLKFMAEKYKVERTYTDLNEMLKLTEIDAVSVCTWNSQHAPCSIAALNAGKHVICEKPMATSYEDAVKMEEASIKNNKLLMVGFVKRFSDECKVIKELNDKDFFGEMYYSKATYLRRKGNPGGWFGDKARSGGGPLIDLGVHVIDFVRYLSGNPKVSSVYGVTYQKLFDRRNIKMYKQYTSISKTDNDICDVEDLAAAIIKFENGLSLNIETSFALNIKGNKTTTELFGTKGGAKIDDTEKTFEIYSEINDYLMDITPAITAASSMSEWFEKELAHFVDCFTNNIECIAPAKDGMELMKILDMIYLSAEKGQEIKVN